MTLIKRYNKTPETISLFDSLMGRDFYWEPDHFFNRTGSKPAVNISETDDTYLLEVAAPGFKKNDFTIEVEKSVLTISAEKNPENEDTEKYHLHEFYSSNFKRSFALPENKVDESSIEAHYEAGILTLKINKLEAAKPKPKRIINIA